VAVEDLTFLIVVRDFIFNMADIWSGLVSIPHCVTIYPRNLQEVTSKVHFSRLSFILNFQRRANASPKILRMVGAIETFTSMSLTYTSIVFPISSLKTSFDHPLESGSDILQAEGHDFIAMMARPVVKAVLSSSSGFILI